MRILKGDIQERESGYVNQANQVQMGQESGSLSGACSFEAGLSETGLRS